MEQSNFLTNNSDGTKDSGCGLILITRLLNLLRIIFSSRICLILVIFVCVLAILEQIVIYYVGLISSEFFKVLLDKNWKGFWMQVLKSVILVVAICLVISCKKYIINIYYVSSRENLTHKLHKLYYEKNKFYFLNTFDYSFTDNPDQRITQDIDKFCNKLSSILGPVVIAPFTISYYSYACFDTTGWMGPLSIYVLFIFSATANKFLMKPIISRVIKQEKLEGFFRFKHMHVRTYAESIAFQGACIVEMIYANHKLNSLIKTQQSLYLTKVPLEIAVNLFNYIGSILSYLIVAFPLFTGKFDNLESSTLSALISKNAFICMYLISCFSSLITLSSDLSEIGGLTHRVFEIVDILRTDNTQLEEICFENGLQSGEGNDTDYNENSAFQLVEVTICPPNENKALIQNLNLDIVFGTNLLITGKSSSGKTSIFRVIKKLWPIHAGCILRKMAFSPSSVFFLPQRTLLSDGTLMDQVLYPLELPKMLKSEKKEKDLILRLLSLVELDHLLQKAGLDDKVEWNWYDVLSPGEAQRLSFARLFYHKPKIAFVDEGTSALGLEMEDKLYNKCKELHITMISIGHRESLLQHHDFVLNLEGEGTWSLTSTEMRKSNLCLTTC